MENVGTGFNALNGQEAMDVILTKVRAALEKTGEFKQNIAFPLPKFEFDVRVWVYPKQNLNGEAGIKASAMVGEAEGDPDIVVTQSATVTTPDKARQEADLPIPRAQSAAKGIIVDVPQDLPKEPTKAESIQEAIKAAIPTKAEVKK